MINPKFNIGDSVYHITPESDQGVVINIRYDYLTKTHEYFVTFSPTAETLWYYEHEITKTIQFKK